MSILNYFRRKTPKDRGEFLPEVTEASSSLSERTISSANNEVRQVSDTAALKAKRQKTEQHSYSGCTCASIGRYASLHGPTAASREFSKRLNHRVPESTARKFRDLYVRELERQRINGSPSAISSVLDLPVKIRGRPLMLGDFDAQVQEYIVKLRGAGGVVNTAVVMAVMRGIVLSRDRTLLEEHGGHLRITKTLALSLLKRMNFVKRKGSTSAKVVPAEFDKIRDEFLDRIKTAVADHSIPSSLIVNSDETGLKLVPQSEWTMEKEGAKKVPIKGLDDKREVTAFLSITPSGVYLPPQVLYQGTTERCHPVYQFPDNWDIWHSSSHWSTQDTVERFVDKVIVPYVQTQRDLLGLPAMQKALLIFDVFAAHRVESVLSKLDENNVLVIFIPPNCTDMLQPLDISVNKPLKAEIKRRFINWYSDEVKVQLDNGIPIEEINIHMPISKMKPLAACWLVGAFDYLQEHEEFAVNGFKEAGIFDLLTC